MNLIHRWFCKSDRWRRTLSDQLLPWALNGVDLGDDPLEIGSGPGLATDWLRDRVPRLTAVEIDSGFARSLSDRLAGSNVTVVEADATDLPLPDGSFSAAVCFTMLHHVPSAALQDRLLREVHRVLEPGGVFAGSDSSWSRTFAMIHWQDTLVAIDPATFPARLERVGFSEVSVQDAGRSFRFRARKQ